ncbi:MAG: PKD domain-containing protein [Pseudorhodoferax sp.]
MRKLLIGLSSAAVMLIAACGGGGDDDGPAAGPVPTAVAAADQTRVPVGTLVTLDGSASSVAGGGSITYQWALAGKPTDSTAALSDAAAAKPSFTPDRPGEYVADLVVQSGSASSMHVRLTIVATNPDPVAVIAAQAQGVLLGSTVELDGSASLPPTDGAASELRYEWRLVSQPEGSGAVLRNATTARAHFVAEAVGIYRATLVVHHGSRSTAPLEAVITVNTSNASPVAKAVAPTTVVRGTTVTLDGSGSTDADGDTLTYRWRFPFYSSGGGAAANAPPRANTATIRNADSAIAEFVPDAVGNYDVILTVYDGSVASTQKVTIAVTRPQGAANILPVAVIGTGAATSECEIGGYCALASGFSHDADGDALTRRWTYWNVQTPNNRQTATGDGLYALSYSAAAGTYEVQLIVNDGTVDSAPAMQTVEIKTGANVGPVPLVSVDRGTVMVGETFTFDASGSTDRNGDQMSFEWTLVDRPNGSNAVLQNANTSRARVVADRAGVYTAMVVVTDSRGATVPLGPRNFGTVFAKALNNPPLVARVWAHGDGQSEVLPGQAFVAAQEGSSLWLSLKAQIIDPDLDYPLYYIITPTQQPAGAAIAAVSSTTGSGAELNTYFELTVPGTYEFEVLVSDGTATSQPVRQSVTFVDRANYPSLLMERGDVVPDVLNVKPSEYPWQQFFPYALSTAEDVPGRTDEVWYRLTAVDRDYTIADLQVGSANAAYRPSFRGLQNGQIIARGQSVEFTLDFPVIPDAALLRDQLRAIADDQGTNSEAYRLELARQQQLLATYRFSGSFRVAERDGYTFYVGQPR